VHRDASDGFPKGGSGMNDRVLRMDLENVQTVNLAKVPDDAQGN
jgi:hypothetical protein